MEASMKYYVYKVTNKINGKWYIGKRKHNSPHEDSYMGSGKLIKEAIKKHGTDCFEKHIIEIFDNNDDAAKLEASLVTKESISTHMSYNMHEGGHGGFAHLNDGSAEHIERCKKGAKNTTGRNHPNWGQHAWKPNDPRQNTASKRGTEKLKIMNSLGLLNGRNKKISEIMKTDKNNMKGKCWCVLKNATTKKDKKPFPIDQIPPDWISLKEYDKLLKNKTSNYGKIWIYNPILRQNKYTNGDIPQGWYKGRKMEYYHRNGG